MTERIHILDELKALDCTVLMSLENKNIFTYPEGYFDELPATINRNIWFQQFSPAMLYAVPNGYFDNFPELMLDKLSVGFNVANTSYHLPKNYFDSLADNILQKIKTEKATNVQEELEAISPLLSKIPKANVYTVPAGYFEKEINIKHTQPAKVISITAKPRKWFSYAAAACVAAVMFVGGYFYIANKTSDTISSAVAKINVDKAISQLPDSTLGNYLANDNSDMYSNQNSSEQELNVQDMINNTSDEDIENYLNQHSAEDDAKGS